MTSFNFTTQTVGKWILAGEHAVLRGHGALVFPLTSKTLTLNYHATPSDLHAEFSGPQGESLHLLFWSVLEHGLHLLHRSLHDIHGYFHVENHIPIGVGMGASAALCVAMARWFHAQQWITAEALFDFAKQLEDLFHGKSSGLDIIGVASQHGHFFQQGKCKPIEATWQPTWCLSSCHQSSMTSQCIQKVQEMWEQDQPKAATIDLQMAQSVQEATTALSSDPEHAQLLLSTSLQRAHDCFEQWGLINATLAQHIQQLRTLGALAAKPTGSGGGGYVLSLWAHKPVLPLDVNAAWIWV